jgi:hypothetical protein
MEDPKKKTRIHFTVADDIALLRVRIVPIKLF